MSHKINTILAENLKEIQEENDRKEFFPFMSQREMYEAMKPDRVGEKDYIRKMMESGIGKVGANPFKDDINNDPRKSHNLYNE